MAITADKIRYSRATNNRVDDVFAITTSNTVYVGALVNFVTSTGRVASATAAASRNFAGVVEEIVNESGSAITAATGNTSGTIKARISWGHEVLVNVKTAARTFANVGRNLFVFDNDAVTDTTGAGTAAVRVKVGALSRFEASDKSTGWIALRVYGQADAT